MYAIGAVKKSDDSRVFFGYTHSGNLLWTKNKDYISYFDSVEKAETLWDGIQPYLSPLMMDEVLKESVVVGNLDFVAVRKLEVI